MCKPLVKIRKYWIGSGYQSIDGYACDHYELKDLIYKSFDNDDLDNDYNDGDDVDDEDNDGDDVDNDYDVNDNDDDYDGDYDDDDYENQGAGAADCEPARHNYFSAAADSRLCW